MKIEVLSKRTAAAIRAAEWRWQTAQRAAEVLQYEERGDETMWRQAAKALRERLVHGFGEDALYDMPHGPRGGSFLEALKAWAAEAN